MAYRNRFSPALSVAAVLALSTPAYATEVPRPSATPKSQGTTAGPELSSKTKMAVKLAGLMTFVASSCPALQPDYSRFKGALGALGVSATYLERTEIKGSYLSYVLRYKEDVAGNCARALQDFGPSGSVIANLVTPRAK